ncbi:hypothetical protein [Sulfuriferula sp.]|uniref:hypothetical protein n=1 Tax=Sulfuriferula sp. TaxID=2025307 RepID=UPI00272F47A1|nr:hypothetical protein [Sulfuriferula sp.]MDP2025375.1 hypothetical protein [Sulfuriferula sp.]
MPVFAKAAAVFNSAPANPLSEGSQSNNIFPLAGKTVADTFVPPGRRMVWAIPFCGAASPGSGKNNVSSVARSKQA